MEGIAEVLAALGRDEIDDAEAEALLAELGAAALAEFVVDARNRGWISDLNLGIGEDGER